MLLLTFTSVASRKVLLERRSGASGEPLLLLLSLLSVVASHGRSSAGSVRVEELIEFHRPGRPDHVRHPSTAIFGRNGNADNVVVVVVVAVAAGAHPLLLPFLPEGVLILRATSAATAVVVRRGRGDCGSCGRRLLPVAAAASGGGRTRSAGQGRRRAVPVPTASATSTDQRRNHYPITTAILVVGVLVGLAISLLLLSTAAVVGNIGTAAPTKIFVAVIAFDDVVDGALVAIRIGRSYSGSCRRRRVRAREDHRDRD